MAERLLLSTVTTSYAGNVMVFNAAIQFPINVVCQDGASNTVMITERYSNCSSAYNSWAMIYPDHGSGNQIAAFGWDEAGLGISGDLYVDFATPKTSPTLGFQVAPTIAACNNNITQTPHPAGMVVGLVDGSVRLVTQSLSVTNWILACTPADGTPLGPDW